MDSLLNIAPDPLQDTILDNTHQVAQYAELLDTNNQVEEQINLEPAPSDTSNSDVHPPILTLFIDDDKTNDESVDVDLTVDNISSAQVNCEIAVLLNDFDEDIESKVGTTEDDNPPIYVNDAEISIEETTPIEIRGPPATETVALSGMHLVDPTVDYFDGQIVYLDFDGAQDVTYNGSVVVEGINISEFSADAAGLAGQESAVISQTLSALEQEFEGAGVLFTTSKPDPGTSYSTVFVGGDGSDFFEYGSFQSLAEKVDVANQDSSDSAFVFSEVFVSGHTEINTLAIHLVSAISHEVGHLLGYEHDQEDSDGGILSTVADTYTSPTGSNHYYNIYITSGTHKFVVDGIFAERWTEWYVDGVYTGDTDHSWLGNGYWDPDHSHYFSSGTTYIEAKVYDGDWNLLEYHGWNCTIDTTSPTVPVLVSPSNGAETSDTTVYLDWSNSSDSGTGVDYYQVQVDNNSSFSSPEFDATPISSNDTTSSLSDGYYYWHVRARDNAGNWSSWSSYRTFRVDTTAPSTPVLSSPANGSSTSDQTPTFDWANSSDSGSGVNHYEIEIYDWDITWGDISDTTTVSQYTPSENIPYDRIYWKVRAVDDVGNTSSWSSEWWLDIVEPKVTAIHWEYPAGSELADGATKNVGDTVYIAVDTIFMRGSSATVYLYEDDGLFGW